jgi:hypothetical protein
MKASTTAKAPKSVSWNLLFPTSWCDDDFGKHDASHRPLLLLLGCAFHIILSNM